VKTIELSTATKPLAEYAAELGDEPIILTSDNKAVAALIPLDHLDTESLALSLNPQFTQLIAEARAEIDAGKTISLEEMEREIGID
jgi:PHD/YefM family antitoxin component YafN of YafNO toxin-antitoxin module